MSKHLSDFDALMILVNDAYSQRTTLAGYKRVVRAIAVFGLTASEACRLTHRLDYTDEIGTMYAWLSKAYAEDLRKQHERRRARASHPQPMTKEKT